jgi:hypothetical protein
MIQSILNNNFNENLKYDNYVKCKQFICNLFLDLDLNCSFN